MSLSVPSDLSDRVRGATSEVVDHDTFVDICKKSLPGAVKMYELLKERLAWTGEHFEKKCFHGFTDAERGHVIRACYGDAINRELNESFGLVLVRVAPGRVAGFRTYVPNFASFRGFVFKLSAQKAHEDDTVETPEIVDHPDTLREIERLYPLAYASLAARDGQPFTDLESKKDPELFRQTVEMLSIRPYRFLLEDAFGPIATVNCCGSAGKGKKGKEKPRDEPQLPSKSGDTLGELSWDFIVSRTLQIQQQEPYLLDC